MLVLDTEAQQRWALTGSAEYVAEQRLKALQHEILSNTISVRDDGGRDTSSLLAQMGRFLPAPEVRRRLTLCNPNLIFVRAPKFPEKTGIYIERDERDLTGGWVKKRIFICGMPSDDVMPEFSVLHVTMKKVPNPEVVKGGGAAIDREAVKWIEVPTFDAETRGWRTVLLRLLHVQLITRGDVQTHFGWETSKESKIWHEMTQ